MQDQLSALDVSFLDVERHVQPLHVGALMVFDPPPGEYEPAALVEYLRGRMALVPRYRRRLRKVLAGALPAQWVDDERFDITYHVRRTALPSPGSAEQLNEVVSRITDRALDRRRPLWELYIVEGLASGGVALVTKTHPALIDGITALDLSHVALSDSPSVSESPAPWQPDEEPSSLEMIAATAVSMVLAPSRLVSGVQHIVQTGRVGRLVSDISGAVAAATRSAPESVLNREPVGSRRQFVTYDTPLARLVALRDIYQVGVTGEAGVSGRVTVNDVVLAVLTGALRAWLLGRGEPILPSSSLRVLLPLSVDHGPRSDADADSGADVDAHLVDLPVGEPNPALRLRAITYQLSRHAGSAEAVGARGLTSLAGFAPSTFQALGVRLAAQLSGRLYNIMITNMPGPQKTLYARDLPLVATYPVMPLTQDHALTIGVTSYNGTVHFGFNGDPDILVDLDDLSTSLGDAFDELEGAV